MLTTVVEIQSKNAMHLSVQTSVSIMVSLRNARSAAKEAHITSQNATQCAIPLPCLAPWLEPQAMLHVYVMSCKAAQGQGTQREDGKVFSRSSLPDNEMKHFDH